MNDSEKVELINQMLKDFWDNGTVEGDGCICMLNAIATVIYFKKGRID